MRQILADALVFKHDVGFRINHMDILSRKYNYPVLALYDLWRRSGRCSFIRLEDEIRRFI